MIFQISYSSFALFRSLCWLAPTPYLRNPLQQIEARQCIGSHRRWLWLVLVSTKQYLLEDAWDIGDYSRIILPFYPPVQTILFADMAKSLKNHISLILTLSVLGFALHMASRPQIFACKLLWESIKFWYQWRIKMSKSIVSNLPTRVSWLEKRFFQNFIF